MCTMIWIVFNFLDIYDTLEMRLFILKKKKKREFIRSRIVLLTCYNDHSLSILNFYENSAKY